MWELLSFAVFVWGLLAMTIWGCLLILSFIDEWPYVTQKEGEDFLIGLVFLILVASILALSGTFGITRLTAPPLTLETLLWLAIVCIIELCCFEIYCSRRYYTQELKLVKRLLSWMGF